MEDSVRQRWQGDEIGQGIGDASALAPGVRRLLESMALPRWVAESPDLHLLPNIQPACSDEASPWSLIGADLEGSLYVIRLEWKQDDPGIGSIRSEMFALLGSIAETTTFVQQRLTNDAVIFEVCTGLLEVDTHFDSHGHIMRFEVGGSAVEKLLARRMSPVA